VCKDKVRPVSWLCRHRREVGVWLQPIRKLGAKRRWVVTTTPRPLYPLERDLVPIVEETVWVSETVWTGSALNGTRSPDHPARRDSLHEIRRPIYISWPVPVATRSAAARLLRLWARVPPWAWMSVCCECCVLSGRGLCVELITRLEESYRLWCVVVWDLET